MQEFLNSITTAGVIVGFVAGALFATILARIENARRK